MELVLAPRFQVQPAELFAWLPVEIQQPISPRLEQAEANELRKADPRGAAARYEQLLLSAPPRWRGWVALRLARNLKAAGQQQQALQALNPAAEAEDSPGPLPTPLAAWFELCSALDAAGGNLQLQQAASRHCRDIRAGTWRLERSSYSFYESKLREWSDETPADVTRRQAMSLLLERVPADESGWLEENGSGVLVLRDSQGSRQPSW